MFEDDRLIGSIDLHNGATAEDLYDLVRKLDNSPFLLDYINDPQEDEPDFYLCVEDDA